MRTQVNPELAEVRERAGIIFPGAVDWAPRSRTPDGGWAAISDAAASRVAMDAGFAWGGMDAQVGTQPTLITTANAGIPAFLTTWVDPQLIEILVTPNKAAEIYGEERKGDWLTETAMFPIVESTGEVSSYGDYANNGRAGANTQWENRQSYLYQTFTFWGEREMERMGVARIDWAARLNIASALVLNKFQNNSYFFGIAGLLNYGALNDPSLSAALTPATKTAGGTGWRLATPNEILADVQYMFSTLQVQTGSNLEMNAPMTLALHSVSENYLANTNSFGLTAMEMINKVYKGLRVVQAPQFLSGTTYSCQLIVSSIEGQDVVGCAFNEKMRAHRIVAETSSWHQKKTQGTWGTIIKMPIGIVSMAGI